MLRRFAWKQLLLPLACGACWSFSSPRVQKCAASRSSGYPSHGGEALAISLAQWSAWGALALIIIWIDRRMPIERDALFRRFLFHVPLSVIFTVAYTYLYHVNLTSSTHRVTHRCWLVTSSRPHGG